MSKAHNGSSAGAQVPDPLRALRQQLADNPADLALALRLADALIGAGRPAEAVQLLTTRTRDPGCRARLREYLAGERELSLLQRLLAHRIDDAVVAQVDAVLASHLAGDYARAINLAQAVLRSHPGHAPAYNHLGRALFNSGEHAAARQAFEQALTLQPDYPEALHNLAQVLRSAGQFAAAEACFCRALELAPAYRSAWLHLGITLLNSGRLAEASTSFERLLQFNPDHPAALLHAGSCRMLAGDLQTAGRMLARAAQLDPRNPAVFEQLGELGLLRGDAEAALVAFRKLLELAPEQLGIWAAIASAQQLAGRDADARNALEHGLRQAPRHPVLLLASARMARQQGRFAEALQQLQQIEAGQLSGRDLERLNFELGQCLDQDGQHAAAFAAFERANAAASRGPLAAAIDFDALDRRLAAVGRWLDEGALLPALHADEDQGEDLCFVVGFPLSTDLALERLLDVHPALLPVRGLPALDALCQHLQTLPGEYPAALGTLDRAGRDHLRSSYRQALQSITGPAAEQAGSGRIVVERTLLHCVDVPFIHRLFPRARFVLALRHPADAVLANFMQPGAASVAGVHFYTLEETARVYGLVMQLWLRIRGLFPALSLCTLRHEVLVQDPQGALQPLCEFLGLPWTAALQAALLPTPAPLRRAPLRERYREQVQPLLPQLQTLAVRLGYAAAS